MGFVSLTHLDDLHFRLFLWASPLLLFAVPHYELLKLLLVFWTNFMVGLTNIANCG